MSTGNLSILAGSRLRADCHHSKQRYGRGPTLSPQAKDLPVRIYAVDWEFGTLQTPLDWAGHCGCAAEDYKKPCITRSPIHVKLRQCSQQAWPSYSGGRGGWPRLPQAVSGPHRPRPEDWPGLLRTLPGATGGRWAAVFVSWPAH